jgi:hypothetical protein
LAPFLFWTIEKIKRKRGRKRNEEQGEEKSRGDRRR